jgi:hypothetical protein
MNNNYVDKELIEDVLVCIKQIEKYLRTILKKVSRKIG